MNPQVLQHYLLKRYLSSIEILLILVKKKIS